MCRAMVGLRFILCHNDSCFLYSYTIVRLGDACENLQFMFFIRIISSKPCSKTNVAIDEPRRVFIELMADKKACVKIVVVEVFEYIINKFGDEGV